MSDRYIFAIGDVHGCYNTLLSLLMQFPKDKPYELIFLGDLCDKGNYSKEVFEFVINNGHKSIKGNHEHMMSSFAIDSLIHNKRDSNWISNPEWGGDKTLINYENDIESLLKHINWIESLPYYIEVSIGEKIFFLSHGYALPYYSRKDNEKNKRSILSNRIDAEKYRYDWEDILQHKSVVNIFGHCNVEDVLVDVNKQYYCIDTGCVYGNKLTAIELNALKIYQEPLSLVDSSFATKKT